MYTARKKIQKDKDLEPSEFEDSVAQAFFDLENGNQELKSDLKDLYINNAIQMDVTGSRKAVVIHVPYRLRKAFRKIHVRLVRELEKKFSGKVFGMSSLLIFSPQELDYLICGQQEIWEKFKHIMRELQGAILVGSVFQIILGYTGLISLFLRLINPVVVAPTIAAVGLAFLVMVSLRLAAV
uniref:40S ribosomal protein S7 n=1 Tax=Zea mays TaxID=4577 RepID=A0A804RE86_MAIZE